MILVEVKVPSMNKKYDFKLEENAFVADIITEVGEVMFSVAGGGQSEMIEDMLLCDYERRFLLPLNKTLKQCGVGNGSRLMLI